jgi:hypothetical protein
MGTYRNQNFQGRNFVLEDVAFVKCKLTDCDLYYSGGDFDWIETTFEGCRFHWRGAAKNMFALAQTVGMVKAAIPPHNMIPPSAQKVN